MTTNYDKLRELAEARVGVSDVELAPDAILSLLDALEAATERAEMAERDRDEAIEDRKLVRDDAARAAAMLAARMMERDEARKDVHDSHYTVEQLIRERDEARAERDARPEITAEDAAEAAGALGAEWDFVPFAVRQRVNAAFCAHARKAVEP